MNILTLGLASGFGLWTLFSLMGYSIRQLFHISNK